MKRIFFVSVALILLFVSSAIAQNRQLTQADAKSESRVALVIGNSAYEIAPLKNPVNDAKDMAQALQELGFEVIYRENLNQNDMKRAIRAFGEKLRGGGVGLFYYAGHGVQVRGINFLVPVNAKVESEEEVEYECVDAGFVLAQMESAGNSMNIVILDACRNNPFTRSFRSTSRGLAQMDAPSGTLIAYATAPGSVANDGDARNGLYTQELLKNISTPDLGIEEAFKRVRISVRNLTQGKQTPWESSSLVGSFYFTEGAISTLPPNPQTTLSPPDPAAIELAYWQSIQNSVDPADFRAYLREYPSGRFVALARNRINNLETSVSKPKSSTEERTFDFSGLVIKIFYRDKDGRNRLEDATRIAARLKSLGAITKIEKNNYKDYKNKVYYGYGPISGEMATKIAKSVSDIQELLPERTNVKEKNSIGNEYYIWLQ